MFKLKLLAGALVVFVVALAVASGVIFWFERAAFLQVQALTQLGESKAVLPSDAMQPLWQACKGKLTRGGPQSIVAYIARMEPEKKPRNDDNLQIDRCLVVLEKDFLYDNRDKLSLTTWRGALAPTWSPLRYLDLFEWSNRITERSRAAADLEKVKYLVVARYDSLELPTVTSAGFVPGGGRYGARVLAVPSGEVLCEGRGVPTMPGSVEAHGSGRSDAEAKTDAEERSAKLVPFIFANGALASPLHMVCDVGGPELCDETGDDVGYHPDVYGR